MMREPGANLWWFIIAMFLAGGPVVATQVASPSQFLRSTSAHYRGGH
jgi:hypothetical protein